MSLLAGLGKCHARERGGQSLSVHLTSRALQVIVLPDLRIGGLKPQYTATEQKRMAILHTPHTYNTITFQKNKTKYQIIEKIIHRTAENVGLIDY